MTNIIKGAEITEAIPHRFENVLIDQVTLSDVDFSGCGDLEIMISENDTQGREIFTQKIAHNKQIIMSPIIMEMLALGAIICSGKLPEDQLVFYSVIQNYEKKANLLVGERGLGTIKKISDKAGFLKYAGLMRSVNGHEIASGNMMAYIADKASLSEETKKKEGALPVSNCQIAVDKTIFHKDLRMVFIDAITLFAENPLLFSGRYTFPLNHPLIKGHFPDNPVMMGVLMWAAFEDACFALAWQLNKSGKNGSYTIKGNGELLSVNTETIICELKDFVVQVFPASDDSFAHAELIATKKVYFRDFIVPGQRVEIVLKDLQIE